MLWIYNIKSIAYSLYDVKPVTIKSIDDSRFVYGMVCIEEALIQLVYFSSAIIYEYYR